MNDAIKAMLTMIVSAIGYVVMGSAMSNVLSHTPLNADAKFAFFVIGLLYGVYVSHRQEWIG